MKNRLVRIMMAVAVVAMWSGTVGALPQEQALVLQEPGDVIFMSAGPIAGWDGKTVTGAPFTAQLSTDTVHMLADGNKIEHKSSGTIARDEAGRTRREMALLPPLAGEGASHVVITDPTSGKGYFLNEKEKTAREFDLHGSGKHMKDRALLLQDGAEHLRGENAEVTKESLGQKTIAGVITEGTHITKTIPAGEMGNEKPIVIEIERWYSPDLQVNVLEKHSDPRFGTVTRQLSNISRQQPDESLFTVPADFSVTQAKPGAPGGLD